MEIEKAAEMGFCFGVKRAVKIVEKIARERGPLKSLGPIVHNPQVIKRLASYGVSTIESLNEVQSGPIVIPSHGVSSQVIAQLQAKGCEIIDTTCPIVQKAQTVAQRLAEEGFWVLIFGDAAHPEVQGLLAWAGDKAMAVLKAPKFDASPHRIGVLSQTTQSPEEFSRFLKKLIAFNSTSVSELRILNTICDVTRRRQAAALELAKKVDLMIVIGGRNSANTRHLAKVCASTGVETYHIETAAELDRDWLQSRSYIGLTAGASTPDWVIDEVMLKLKEIAQ
jgi:4-hydroxy-3-methylbut-2-enyl diphosphate reductase